MFPVSVNPMWSATRRIRTSDGKARAEGEWVKVKVNGPGSVWIQRGSSVGCSLGNERRERIESESYVPKNREEERERAEQSRREVGRHRTPSFLLPSSSLSSFSSPTLSSYEEGGQLETHQKSADTLRSDRSCPRSWKGSCKRPCSSSLLDFFLLFFALLGEGLRCCCC